MLSRLSPRQVHPACGLVSYVLTRGAVLAALCVGVIRQAVPAALGVGIVRSAVLAALRVGVIRQAVPAALGVGIVHSAVLAALRVGVIRQALPATLSIQRGADAVSRTVPSMRRLQQVAIFLEDCSRE